MTGAVYPDGTYGGLTRPRFRRYRSDTPHTPPPQPVDDWRERAACRPDDNWSQAQLRAHVESFHPKLLSGRPARPVDERRRPEYAAALAYCASCPVTEPCLLEALATPEGRRYGVRGGTIPAERVRMPRLRSTA